MTLGGRIYASRRECRDKPAYGRKSAWGEIICRGESPGKMTGVSHVSISLWLWRVFWGLAQHIFLAEEGNDGVDVSV